MDRDRLFMMLDGFYVPGTNDVSVASVVDREPVAIIGNCLVFRVGQPASFLAIGKASTRRATLYELYADRQPAARPAAVSLPTDGLYAQTIMDECVALEEHYGNLDWALDDPDPELGRDRPVSCCESRRAEPVGTTPTAFPQHDHQPAERARGARAATGVAGVLGGRHQRQCLPRHGRPGGHAGQRPGGLEAAAGLATNFGNQAAALGSGQDGEGRPGHKDGRPEARHDQEGEGQGAHSGSRGREAGQRSALRP